MISASLLHSNDRLATYPPSWYAATATGYPDTEQLTGAHEADRLNTIIYTMMAQNCGKKDDYFKKKVFQKKHADWFMGPEEAKKHGMANHLRLPIMNIKVAVDIDFE